MISERMIQLASGGSAIRAMFEEGKRLADQFGAENVFDFSIGNPSFPPPDCVKDAIIDIMTNGDPMSVHGYPANAGFPEVREAVAKSLNRRFGTDYNAGNIIMTVGAAGGLNVILRVLCNPGDEVIVISPYFFEYNNYIGNADAKVVVVPAAAEEGFMPDLDAIGAAITPKTKAMILNNPNNPTGVIYPADMLEKLGALLEAKGREFGTVIYLISDEPYRELAYDGAVVPWLPSCCKTPSSATHGRSRSPSPASASAISSFPPILPTGSSSSTPPSSRTACSASSTRPASCSWPSPAAWTPRPTSPAMT